MAKKTLKLEGKVFNFLEVISRSETNPRKWLCLCECGNYCETTHQRLKSGRAKSCGCKKSQLMSEAFTRHGASSGGKNGPEYQSYVAMMHRCYNPTRASWKRYGGRGIIVSEQSWLEKSPHGFLNFLADMGERQSGTSLDRIDNQGNYCKENCRWAGRRVQGMNTENIKNEKSTSKYRGVSQRKSNGKFMARIGNGLGGYEWLGEYEDENSAAMAYNKRAFELYGDDAPLNIIE